MFVQVYGGNFQLSDGQPLASSPGVPNPYGQILFTLSQAAVVLDTSQICPPTVSFPLNAEGSVPQTPAYKLWGNDSLAPSGTFYRMIVYDGTGALVYGPTDVVIMGPSPINLATLTPASSTVSYPGAVLLNPAGDQTIQEFSLLPASGNTTQSLGFQGAEWNASLLNVGIYGTLTDSKGFQGFQGEVLQSTGVGTQWGPAGSGPQGPQGFQGFQGPAGSAASNVAFGSITTGSNTTAAMTVGSGASMTTSGTGTINANKLEGVTISGTPSTGQTLVATSSSAADWATGFLNLPANGLRLEYGGATGTTTVTFSPAFSGTPSVLLSTGPGTGTTQLNTTSNTQFSTISSDGAPFTWLAIGPA